MKGNAPFVIGLLMVVMVTVIFMAGTGKTFEKQINVASSSVQLYVAENNAESIKRSLDSLAHFSTLAALRETFDTNDEWDSTGPTESQFISSFNDKVSAKIDAFFPQTIGDKGKSGLKWNLVNVKSEFLGDGVRVYGEKSFDLKNFVNPNVTLSSSGAFDRKAKINAKKLFADGRALFDGAQWRIESGVINSEGDECKKKVQGRLPTGEYYDFETKNILSAVIMCGHQSMAGALSENSFKRNIVTQKITDSLNNFAAYMKGKTGYDYTFTTDITSQKVGSKEKVFVKIFVSISDTNSQVPIEGGFGPLTLRFKTSTDFEMLPGPAEVSH